MVKGWEEVIKIFIKEMDPRIAPLRESLITSTMETMMTIIINMMLNTIKRGYFLKAFLKI